MTIELTYDKKSLKILNGSLEPLIEGDSKMPNEKEQKESENEETVEAYYCGAIVVITTSLGSIRRVVNVVVGEIVDYFCLWLSRSDSYCGCSDCRLL